MELEIKNLEIKQSNRLGLLPFSLFVEIGNGNKFDIKTAYEAITKYECPDIIFTGDINSYIETLEWLMVRLIAEHYYISIVCDLNNGLPLLHSRRLIVKADMAAIKKRQTLVSNLRENDLLIITENNINTINACIKILSSNADLKCGVGYDSNLISDEEIINKKLYGLIPTEGI
jgi:hypothetical protein